MILLKLYNPSARRLFSTVKMQTLDKLVIDAPAKHTATVIFVHGLGDTGEGWKDLAQLYKAELPHIKWVLPHAPIQPVTGNGGMPMPSWFDIFNFDFDPNRPGKEDYEGMRKTVNSLSQLISSEVDAGVPAERVVLGGFSQGGAMTLLTGLTIERKLAGLAVLSGWAPVPEKLKMSVNRHAKSLPIFWGHGVNDPLVRYEFAVRSLEFLKEELKITAATEDSSKPLAERLKGVELHSYPGLTHSASNAELEDLKKWLKAVIPPIS